MQIGCPILKVYGTVGLVHNVNDNFERHENWGKVQMGRTNHFAILPCKVHGAVETPECGIVIQGNFEIKISFSSRVKKTYIFQALY